MPAKLDLNGLPLLGHGVVAAEGLDAGEDVGVGVDDHCYTNSSLSVVPEGGEVVWSSGRSTRLTGILITIFRRYDGPLV